MLFRPHDPKVSAKLPVVLTASRFANGDVHDKLAELVLLDDLEQEHEGQARAGLSFQGRGRTQHKVRVAGLHDL
ncbi:MAG TPA: hypothetical protein VG125_32410 [Pirellulales bacterium]|nr:hypothetical protein [Pirellulales bacterium]